MRASSRNRSFGRPANGDFVRILEWRGRDTRVRSVVYFCRSLSRSRQEPLGPLYVVELLRARQSVTTASGRRAP